MSPFFSLLFFFFFLISHSSMAMAALVKDPPLVLKYHNGPLLKGKVTLNLLWYGQFTPTQRSIISDFILSLTSTSVKSPPSPSVNSWWRTTDKFKGGASTLILGKQTLDQTYSLGKSLTNKHLIALASKTNTAAGLNNNTVNVVLTANDVAVSGFCSRCGTHSSVRTKTGRMVYAWVGNSETQCPGQCAWPFHQPIYGPQTAPLVAPNGDVGLDGMVINLATVLAGTITNPFNSGYFQGPVMAPLEAVTACTGMFGSGAYPGYAGEVILDKETGASYNAQGVEGRKYLLPAMWDPTTSKCSTLV
ncbi:protein EXORDIUM-like 2 [Impatiens glandulifera]|uniref:protein EXORDIUM-like 2 n=1 Tax=Impatiens glandulifera TaxID=253017 RepID=UPI001FB0C847|nr:protein EXORDIUM-like 2 [Impatiens glandulifera]